MGGEGSIQHMITTLRNNRNMLRKKGMFQRDRSFTRRKEEYHKASKGINTSKKLSKEELLLIRNKVIANRRRENIKAFLVFIIIVILIISMVVFVINS
jgi:hypothetical protein